MANRDIEFSLHCTPTLSAGIDRFAEGDIDVILLDLSLPDSEGPQTFRLLRTRTRQVPIILLSGNDRESVALDLVGSGAQDYIVKSRCTAEALSRAILYAMLRHPQGKEGTDAKASRVVALLSAKGGVGTTTLACALAAELQRQEEGKVLLVDLDVHANQVCFLFGIKPTYTVLDALSNAHRLDESTLKSIVSEDSGGLHVLPSPVLQGQKEPAPDKLQQLLLRLGLYYSWIVLDLGRLHSSALAIRESADTTIVVSSTSLASLYEARRTVATLKSGGCDGEELLLCISDLPGTERLSDASIEDMLGIGSSLRLPESSADLKSRGTMNCLPRSGSDYHDRIVHLVRRLRGAPDQAPTTKRRRYALAWR
jgi:Flp pilus assembly CpaE family ATPase